MIVTITKTVKVEVTSEEITRKRKSGGSLANEGILRDDTTLAYIIANNKAIDAITKNDKSLVQTKTSLDEQVEFNL